jgi:ATP-dependent Lhr-like helicase
MPLSSFHPAVAAWFGRSLGEPTLPQRAAWPAIAAGEHTLIAAPTGSGKTLAAFLWAIDTLVRESVERGALPDETRVLYISPLKALSHDVDKNLQLPLDGIAAELKAGEITFAPVRTWVRTGDTAQKERTAATKRPPHIVVTTPESLFLLLTSEGGRRMLATVRTVIIDEIHALVRDKRGSHLALSLERLEALVAQQGTRLQRIGLSATQKPIDDVAQFLVGARDVPCRIVDSGHRRNLDLALCLPGSPLEAVMSGECWEEIYAQLVALIEAHTTTLVFVNTRRVAERVAKQLSERLGDASVTSHHGSLSREKRLDSEQRLKAGKLKALVATSSLELGIDVGDVDLVCQIASPRSIATFLQRVGRSGHHLRGTPKGRLFPLSRDDLVECVALLDSVRKGELDRLHIPKAPLDVLAQQIVAACGVEDWSLDALYALVCKAAPYRELSRRDFDAVVTMLADGFSTRRGRRAALLHHDAVNGRSKGRRGARLLAITCGGAIPDTFDYEVVLEPEDVRVGTVHEDFAIESMQGDVFQLGNTSYRIRRVESGRLRVEDARGQPPSIPFWVAEAPGRTAELSQAVCALRARVDGFLFEGPEAALEHVRREFELDRETALQLVEYLAATRAMLGVMPTDQTMVLERFFDETDSMHLVLHSPFGTRINRAFGLALRKRFCRSFNVELQAAANDDAVVLSLGPMHSFALEDIFGLLRKHHARDVLIQAMLAAPMFSTRFRWNASRALAVPRFQGGKKVAPRFQRMLSDDLLAVSFPDQVACAENLEGEREIPDHPLVQQTVDDCLHEAMDIDGLEALLERMESGAITCVARDLTEPSPLAQEILNARPYAFLDDAPLEERRTQAVIQRRWLDPATARDLGALDPAAIDKVVAECAPDARDADELHDALLVHAALPEKEGKASKLDGLFTELVATGRAAVLDSSGTRLWIAAERVAIWRLIDRDLRISPELSQPTGAVVQVSSREEALREVVRGRLEAVGPTTHAEIAAALGLSISDVAVALGALEAEGFVLRGRYRPSASDEEWCERRLLARIHRATLERLRREIEPVSQAVLMRFFANHQHASAASRMRGLEGLYHLVEQLAGFEIAAGAWERDILPARMQGYDPSALDVLTWTGRVAWARAARGGDKRTSGPVRTTPIALFPRELLESLRAPAGETPPLSVPAERVRDHLANHGASFLADLTRATGLVRSQVEGALGELVAQGMVTSDGFSGLRALCSERTGREQARPAKRASAIEQAGRYALLQGASNPDAEVVARTLLSRWGVVMRKLLERENLAVPWGELLRVLRRMEARGEVRGGRFIAGFVGEQYAHPDAVGMLRKARRDEPRGELLSLSGADPLNLIGIITPGTRLPAVAASRLLLRDGVPVATLSGGACQFLGEVAPEEHWTLETALRQQATVRPARKRSRPQSRSASASAGTPPATPPATPSATQR